MTGGGMYRTDRQRYNRWVGGVLQLVSADSDLCGAVSANDFVRVMKKLVERESGKTSVSNTRLHSTPMTSFMCPQEHRYFTYTACVKGVSHLVH